jgi:hypothetical protein
MLTASAHVPANTSTVDRAKELCQFYTKPTVAKTCIREMLRYLGPIQIGFWVEPSAGEGAFLHQLPQPRAGMDVDPKSPGIGQLDFMEWNMPWPFAAGPVVVIGTPPFGRNASLAIRFFKHAAQFADYIGLILPRTFQKAEMKRKLDRKFHLVHEHVITGKAFIFKGVETACAAVFQIWERRRDLRDDPVLPRSHPDFAFVKDKAKADLSIQRVGVKAGRVRTAFADRATTSHYFIRDLTPERRVEKILKLIDWTAVKAQCAAVPSIGKTELVRLYAEQLAAQARIATTAFAPPASSQWTTLSPAGNVLLLHVAANEGAILASGHGVDNDAGGSPAMDTLASRAGAHDRRSRREDSDVVRDHDRATPPSGRIPRGQAVAAGARSPGETVPSPCPLQTGPSSDDILVRRTQAPSGGGPRKSSKPAYPVDLSKVVITSGDPLTGNYVEGHLRSDPSYWFEATVYPVGSQYGIEGGRISRLYLRFIGTDPADNDDVGYDRGWKNEPPERHRAAIEELSRAFPEPTTSQHGAHLTAQVRKEIDRRVRDQGPAVDQRSRA